MATATIKFQCPKCKKKIRVPGLYGGKRGGCPACKEFVDIPPESTLPDNDPATSKDQATAVATVSSAKRAAVPAQEIPTAEAELELQPVAQEAPAADAPKAGFVKFTCPSCAKPTGFPASQAGTPAICPSCRTKVMVPEASGGESFIVGGNVPAPKPRPRPEAEPAPATDTAPAGGPPWKLIAVAAVVLVAVLLGMLIGMKGSNDQKQTAQQAPPSNTPSPAPSAAPVPPHAAMQPTPTAQPAAKSEAPAQPDTVKTVAPEPAPTAKTEEPGPFSNPNKEPTPEVKTATPPAEAKTTTPATEAKTTAGNTNPDEEDLKPVAEKPKPQADPATTANPAGPAPENPPKAEPPKPAPVCLDCMGTGHLPVLPPRPYVRMGSDPLPNPVVSAPWIFCAKCQKTRKNDEILKAEGERLAGSLARNKNWNTASGLPLLYVETRYLSLHAQLPPAMAKKTGDALDKLTAHLQSATRSTLLTQTRPATHEILITFDLPSYYKLIDMFEAQDPGEHWKLTRQSTGSFGRKLGFFNAKSGNPTPPDHMALYQFANMLMVEATDGKAPPWLTAGFSAYCEKTITNLNLCYSFSYEKNEVQFGQDWDVELKKYAQQGKLKTWEFVFPLSGIGMSALDYLTCYSMVSYFMKSDPRLFQQVLLNIKDGMESGKAVEKVYKRPVKDLQMMWAQWAMR